MPSSTAILKQKPAGHRARKKAPSRDARETISRMLEIIKSGGDSRQRKVRRMRAAIKVRAYENDLKLQVAIDRLARQISEEL